MPRPHRASWQTVSLPAAALILAGCSPPGPSASEKPSVTAIPVKTVAVQEADVQRQRAQAARKEALIARDDAIAAEHEAAAAKDQAEIDRQSG